MAVGNRAQAGMMMETHEARIKRMTMRSWRRGTKEMDLILGPYADAHIAQMDEDTLRLYDIVLEENDQDLMAVILGQQKSPPKIANLMVKIEEFARRRLDKSKI